MERPVGQSDVRRLCRLSVNNRDGSCLDRQVSRADALTRTSIYSEDAHASSASSSSQAVQK